MDDSKQQAAGLKEALRGFESMQQQFKPLLAKVMTWPAHTRTYEVQARGGRQRSMGPSAGGVSVGPVLS